MTSYSQFFQLFSLLLLHSSRMLLLLFTIKNNYLHTIRINQGTLGYPLSIHHKRYTIFKIFPWHWNFVELLFTKLGVWCRVAKHSMILLLFTEWLWLSINHRSFIHLKITVEGKNENENLLIVPANSIKASQSLFKSRGKKRYIVAATSSLGIHRDSGVMPRLLLGIFDFCLRFLLSEKLFLEG